MGDWDVGIEEGKSLICVLFPCYRKGQRKHKGRSEPGQEPWGGDRKGFKAATAKGAAGSHGGSS